MVDPSCDSSAMFVESVASWSSDHKTRATSRSLRRTGVETGPRDRALGRLNVAVHGLEGRHPPRMRH